MFAKNLDYMLNIGEIRINAAAAGIGVSEATIWNWRNGVTPPARTLRRIADYFTRTLGLPPDVLGDGQILLSENIEYLIKPYIQERSLPSSNQAKSPALNRDALPDGNESSDLKFTFDEKIHLRTLRLIFNRDASKPVEQAELRGLQQLAEMVCRMRGMDNDTDGGRKESDPKNPEGGKG